MNAAVKPLLRPPSAPRQKKPLGTLGVLKVLVRNPLEIWSDLHFEKPFMIGKTYFGIRAMVSEPDAVRRVMLDNSANYRKDPLTLRVLKPALGTGLLTADGDTWKTQRRALSPLFSPRQTASFAPAMHRVVRAGVSEWARTDGAIVNMHEEMAVTALRILEETLFSSGIAREATQFQKAITRYFDTVGRVDPLDVLGAPDYLPRLGRRLGKGALDYLASAVTDIVEARRASIASGATPPEDFLTLLLRAADPETGRGLSEADMRANIITFIGAGHETTANALTWTLYLLSQSPEWRARVEAELDAQFDPADESDAPMKMLPVTRAVFEESMRLYPPAPNVMREAIAEDYLSGHRVPAGAVVSISPYVLHRHKSLWRDPDHFDPSRFMPGEREKIDRYAYIPFGAGPRVCIGSAFALQEGLIVLAHTLRHMRFELLPGHRVELQQRVTLRPRFGMKMIARRRD